MHLNLANMLSVDLQVGLGSLEAVWSLEYHLILVWIMFVGAIASMGQTCRLYFVESLGTICTALGISSKEDFEKALKRIVWLESFCMSHIDQVWDDIIT